MKILLSWLKDYVQFDQSVEELTEDLSMFAHEVESIEKRGNDAILDLEITPNRGDCLSHLGIARQVAAMYDIKLKVESLKLKVNDDKIGKNIKIKISDPKICPRFTARIIDNITISDSPKWLQDRIIAYGFRPINNIVDITNYVMIATGQPLHAFDYDKIQGGQMKIRLSKKGEKLTTLDGKERVLPEEAIVIEDDKNIFDLAGIMGGQNSEVDSHTKTIILQGAIFDPVLIRRASKFLHHQTDASYRYERGVDMEATIYGVNLSADLIKQSTPGAKVGPLIDLKKVQDVTVTIPISADKINHLIGTKLDAMTINLYLERLYFKIDDNTATVPSFRVYDVSIWQDLAEEVARIYGYNNLERILPQKKLSMPLAEDWQKRETIKDELKQKGFSEVYANSFADEDKIKLLGFNLSKCVQVINPITPETKYLRPDLSLSLLAATSRNPWAPELNIFEIEKVFYEEKEFWQLGILCIIKSEKVLQNIKTDLAIKSDIIKINQNILDQYKIRRQVSLLTIKVEDIIIEKTEIDSKMSKNKLKPISKFAPTIRDISIVVDATISSEEIQKEILEASSAILFSEKFDEFVSEKLGQNKKSLAFHIWLQDLNQTLDDVSANKIINDIVTLLENKFQAQLRS